MANNFCYMLEICSSSDELFDIKFRMFRPTNIENQTDRFWEKSPEEFLEEVLGAISRTGIES